MTVDEVAVELYGLAPEDFVTTRNTLAKAAKDTGDARMATAVQSLRKPTLAASLANQLVRVDPDGINDLPELGDELREAHLSGNGPRLRQLSPRRHDLEQATAEDRPNARRRPGPAGDGPGRNAYPRRWTPPWSTPAPRRYCGLGS